MASILILTYEYDNFAGFNYLIKGLLDTWLQMGHTVRVAKGIPTNADADIVIVHTDLSVVPEEYIQFAAQFPVGINRNSIDIRKRLVSRNLLEPGDEWNGWAIVKSDLNCCGFSELIHNQRALQQNRLQPNPFVRAPISFRIFPSVESVPETVWNDPSLVVERFLPERDERGYWLRCWVFFGEAERCSKFCCPDPIVKGTNLIAHEMAPVPDELRIERARLGFDYGKFDFVICEGRAVLLDANRTPGAAARLGNYQDTEAGRLALGIEGYLRGKHAERTSSYR